MTPSPRTAPAVVLLLPLVFGAWVAALAVGPALAVIGAVVVLAVGGTALVVHRERRIRRRAAAPAGMTHAGGAG